MKNVYQIDAAHSSVQFSVRHLMVSNVKGTFSGVTGTVSYDPEKLEQTSIDATVDVTTVNTNDEKRDGHLKSPDFFDVAKYPVMTFKGTNVESSGDVHKVAGELTLHGVTKEVTLTVEDVSAETKDPWGSFRIGANVKGKIKRSDFGLTWNAALETGGVMLGDDVKIEFELQFVKQQGANA
jgi:polyisoprenoid-binding protein YceI